MKERPIIMTGESVRAILDGRKTQTRRVVKNPQRLERPMLKGEEAEWCPYDVVGDRLWVRESFQIEQYTFRRNCVGGKYLADNKEFWTEVYQREYDLIKNRKFPLRATSGRFMYKSLARLWLEITGIRIEQVQDIDAVEAEAEGMRRPKRLCPDRHDEYIIESRFAKYWDSLNARRGYSWESNPWVWVLEFKRMKKSERKESKSSDN